jgi:hypothetical protein
MMTISEGRRGEILVDGEHEARKIKIQEENMSSVKKSP